MIPSLAEIERIPKARCGEFELNDKEAKTLRSRLYAINKDGLRRYRTMRDGPYIVVWRMK